MNKTLSVIPFQGRARILPLDVIRIFACFCVLTIHFNASVSGYDTTGAFTYPNGIVPNYFFGVYLGDIGVSLFFILSGASLEYTHPDGCKSIGKFYVKRIKSLYPQFWIAFSVFTLWSFYLYHVISDAPIWQLLVSLIGMDGYATSFPWNISGFYQCGEWFLGCIVLLYLIFPLLSYGLHKHPVLTWAAALCIYVLIVHLLDETFENYPRVFLLRMPELLLGMSFIRYIKTAKHLPVLIGSGILLLCRVLFGRYLASLTITIITCWTLFLILFLLTELWQEKMPLPAHLVKKIVLISNLTYPLFLVHHKLIFMLASRYDLTVFPFRYTVSLYIIFLFVSICAAVGLETLDKKIRNSLFPPKAKAA